MFVTRRDSDRRQALRWPGSVGRVGLTQGVAAVHRGVEAAGVGVDGHVGGGGVQQRVPDHHREDDALAGEGAEHDLADV